MPKFQKKHRDTLTAFLVVLFLGIAALLMVCSMRGDSGTVDEVAHIPAGYSYDKYLDFRLNPEHPPLAKAISGIPLIFQNLNGLKDDWSWEEINQWESGWYFLYEAGNDPAQILFWSRISIVILTLALGLFLYFWISKWYGKKIGLFSLVLFCFYPDILAHGHLVTTDIAAAFGYVITIYAFDKMLQKITPMSIIWAATAFGIAQLLKFSSFLLFAILFILIIAKAFFDSDENNEFMKMFWKYFKGYFWVCALSVLIVWVVYIPFVWNMSPLIEHKVIEMNLGADPNMNILKNFLHLFEDNVILRGLGHYLLGIVLVIFRVAGGNATYIMDNLSDKGISWFFPVAWLIKTPLPIIILLFWSTIMLFIFRAKNKTESWQRWLFLTPVVVYWAFTLKGSLNIGIRHLLPTIPFIIIFIGSQMYRYFGRGKFLSVQGAVATVLGTWLILSTLSYYPQYIGYFNETVPRSKRYQYLVDSSLDWGQDLLRLKKFVDGNNIDSIKIDYFGGSVPSYYIPQSVEWHSSYGPTTGWLAISATFYQSSKLYGPMEKKWSYEWLDQFEPEAIIGGSILVFHLTDYNLSEHPPTSPYRIEQIDEIGSIKTDKIGLK